MATLSLKRLIKTYNGRRVVNGVTMDIHSSVVVGLLGPNGAGKTTTFYMTVGIIQPNGGRVLFNNDDITLLPMFMRARHGIGYLPQETSVFRKLSVKDNVMAILETLPLTKRQQHATADAILDELGIGHLAKQKANHLSGGERRRLEISRALATNPSFILLDEPFAGIDPLAVIDIKNIIMQLKSKGIGVLISDHNVRETLGVCDEAYIMFDGEIIEQGRPEHIAQSEMACRVYLGNEFRL